MKYIFKVSYFDVKLQKHCNREYLRIYEPNELRMKAKEFVIYYRSLPGVRQVKLDVVELIEGDTLIKGMGL